MQLDDLMIAHDDNDDAIVNSAFAHQRQYRGGKVNVIFFLRERRMRRAMCVFSIAAALLIGSAVFPAALLAKSEPGPILISELKVPSDITEESIEKIDSELSKAAGPHLRTLFDATKPADERLKAAAELQTLTNAIDPSSPEKENLQRTLMRRVSLIQASIEAAQTPATAVPSNLAETASSTVTWLSGIPNGSTWVSYLHLEDLQKPEVSPDVLKQVSVNLSASDSMDAAQKAFASKPQLQSLKAAIDKAIRRSAFKDDTEAAQGELNYQVDLLVASLLSYENDHIAAGAEHARIAWRMLRADFPEAASRLRPAVNQNYFNHNLHVVVSEELLSRLISDYRTETGCIAECILGAWVTGSSNTTVDVRADIKPSLTSASFDIAVSGHAQSSTVAQKSPATIWSRGNNYFWMNKSVFFDGRNVSAAAATFSINTNSQITGLRTEYDGIPIIRGIVRSIAADKIAEGKPKAEAITASKIRDEALPRFESETRQQFADANTTLNKLRTSLEKRDVAPDSISARSSNTHIALSSRTIGFARLGGSVQPPSALIAKGAAVQLHESALNNSIDALNFQGRTIPEKDLTKELEAALSDLLQRDIKLNKDETPQPAAKDEEADAPTSFAFSNTDPIRVHFNNGKIVVVLRTGVLQEGKEPIPEQIITIPIDMSLQGGKIVLEPDKIGVASKEETDRLKQVTRANQIRRILGKRVIRRELSPTVDLQAAGDKTLPLTVTMIQLIDGWLSAEMM